MVRYHLAHDGAVWSELYGINNGDGQQLPDWWKLPLDFRCQVERDGRNRPIRLPKQARSKSGLQQWLLAEGLVSAEDIHVTTTK